MIVNRRHYQSHRISLASSPGDPASRSGLKIIALTAAQLNDMKMQSFNATCTESDMIAARRIRMSFHYGMCVAFVAEAQEKSGPFWSAARPKIGPEHTHVSVEISSQEADIHAVRYPQWLVYSI